MPTNREPTRRILAEWSAVGAFILALLAFLGWNNFWTTKSGDNPPRLARNGNEATNASSAQRTAAIASDDPQQLANLIAGRWAEAGYGCDRAMVLKATPAHLDVLAPNGHRIRLLSIKSRQGSQLTVMDGSAPIRFVLRAGQLQYSEDTWSARFNRCD